MLIVTEPTLVMLPRDRVLAEDKDILKPEVREWLIVNVGYRVDFEAGDYVGWDLKIEGTETSSGDPVFVFYEPRHATHFKLVWGGDA